MVEAKLFEKYSIDTNVIVSFLGDGPDELYPIDAFGPQWNVLEAAFKEGSRGGWLKPRCSRSTRSTPT